MCESVFKTAECLEKIEVLSYLQTDDPKVSEYVQRFIFQREVTGPRITMSDMWNALIPCASPRADIFMLAADDVIFKTFGWDLQIEKAFAEVPDKILLAFADDGGPNGKRFASLPFVSRRWVEVVGYFTGPGFSADYSDTWPNDVADMIERKKYVDVLIEHAHVVWGKAPDDKTYQENRERWNRDRPDLLYARRFPERERDAAKLRAAIAASEMVNK